MHLNQRYDIWVRLSKKSYKKGLNSFRYIGEVMQESFFNQLPSTEALHIRFYSIRKRAGGRVSRSPHGV